MEVSGAGLLLLDLDGVTVFEAEPPLVEALEILRLHELVVTRLAEFGVSVVVLTHRSRAEARKILLSAGITANEVVAVMAAEDLALAALRHGNIRRLFKHGLRKNLILPLVEARFAVNRRDVALLDDRLDNLQDMMADGLGLAMQAPSEVSAEGVLTTFDLSEAVQTFLRWRRGEAVPNFVRLQPVRIQVEDWRRTGLSTKRESRRLFNVLRTTARHIRWARDRALTARRAR